MNAEQRISKKTAEYEGRLIEIACKVDELATEREEIEKYLKLLQELSADEDEEQEEAEEVSPRTNGHSISRSVPRPRVSLMDAVHSVVMQRLVRPFHKRVVADALCHFFPGLPFSEKSLDKPIQRLLRSGLIEIYERGVGREPIIYRRRENLLETNSEEKGATT